MTRPHGENLSFPRFLLRSLRKMMPRAVFSLGSPLRIKTQSWNGCNFIEYLLFVTRGVDQRCPQHM
jgi:hypothetical protein